MRHYGALKELAEQTPFEYDMVRKDKWVASRYEVCKRLHTLTWQYHHVVAAREDRVGWLRRAANGDNGKPRSIRELERQIKAATPALPLPHGVYDVIDADPPWPYDNTIRKWGPAELHYPTMAIEDLYQTRSPGTVSGGRSDGQSNARVLSR